MLQLVDGVEFIVFESASDVKSDGVFGRFDLAAHLLVEIATCY